jgi:hypothetical protein
MFLVAAAFMGGRRFVSCGGGNCAGDGEDEAAQQGDD